MHGLEPGWPRRRQPESGSGAVGFSADHDHAGRSPKGQITYGQKHARATVVLDGDRWTVRRSGELDVVVDGVDELKELLA